MMMNMMIIILIFSLIINNQNNIFNEILHFSDCQWTSYQHGEKFTVTWQLMINGQLFEWWMSHSSIKDSL